MRQNPVEFDGLLQMISQHARFEVRLASSRNALGTLELQSFIGVTLPDENIYAGIVYDYGACVFTQLTISSSELVDELLKIRDTGNISYPLSGIRGASIECALEFPTAQFYRQRVHSRSSREMHPVFDAPYDLYQINTSTKSRFSWNSGPANKEKLPYFRTFSQAACHYLYRNHLSTNSGSPPSFEILLLDERAWIESVIVGEKSLRVLLGGKDLNCCELKLLGLDPDIIEILPASQGLTHSVPMPVLPQELSVVLTLDEEVLDMRDPIRRFVPNLYDDDGRTMKSEPIENYIAWHGENLTVEYKAEWSKEVAKTIVGFANAEGGSIFFGVKDDVDGIEFPGVDNIDEFKNRVNNIIEKTSGHFDFSFETHEIQEKQILRLIVKEANDKPVALTESGIHQFYIRRDGSTRRVRREDMLKWIAANYSARTWNGWETAGNLLGGQ